MPSTLPGQSGILSDDLSAVGDSIVAKLFKNTIEEGNVVLNLGDVHEADFPGYSEKIVTDWSMVPDVPYDRAEAVSGQIEFTAGVITEPQWVTGIYLVVRRPGVADSLLSVQYFPTAIQVREEGQVIPYQARAFSYAGN